MFFYKKNRIHAGVWLWRHTRWQGDSVECMLPRALPVFSPVQLDASVPANGPGGVSAATKGETRSYRPERGSSISDARPESHLWMGVYHYLLLFFSSFLPLSLLLTVFDRIRQVNEKQRGKNNCSPSFSLHLPRCVSACVCIPVTARVWLSCVLGRASLSKTMMIQYESNEKLVHTFRSRSGSWLWI